MGLVTRAYDCFDFPQSSVLILAFWANGWPPRVSGSHSPEVSAPALRHVLAPFAFAGNSHVQLLRFVVDGEN
jgi:hypothetical protein